MTNKKASPASDNQSKNKMQKDMCSFFQGKGFWVAHLFSSCLVIFKVIDIIFGHFPFRGSFALFILSFRHFLSLVAVADVFFQRSAASGFEKGWKNLKNFRKRLRKACRISVDAIGRSQKKSLDYFERVVQLVLRGPLRGRKLRHLPPHEIVLRFVELRFVELKRQSKKIATESVVLWISMPKSAVRVVVRTRPTANFAHEALRIKPETNVGSFCSNMCSSVNRMWTSLWRRKSHREQWTIRERTTLFSSMRSCTMRAKKLCTMIAPDQLWRPLWRDTTVDLHQQSCLIPFFSHLRNNFGLRTNWCRKNIHHGINAFIGNVGPIFLEKIYHSEWG